VTTGRDLRGVLPRKGAEGPVVKQEPNRSSKLSRLRARLLERGTAIIPRGKRGKGGTEEIVDAKTGATDTREGRPQIGSERKDEAATSDPHYRAKERNNRDDKPGETGARENSS